MALIGARKAIVDALTQSAHTVIHEAHDRHIASSKVERVRDFMEQRAITRWLGYGAVSGLVYVGSEITVKSVDALPDVGVIKLGFAAGALGWALRFFKPQQAVETLVGAGGDAAKDHSRQHLVRYSPGSIKATRESIKEYQGKDNKRWLRIGLLTEESVMDLMQPRLASIANAGKITGMEDRIKTVNQLVDETARWVYAYFGLSLDKDTNPRLLTRIRQKIVDSIGDDDSKGIDW